MASAETDTSSFPSEEKECGTLKEIQKEIIQIINSSVWDPKDGKKEMVILGAKIQILLM